MIRQSDHANAGRTHVAKAQPGSPEYKAKTAEPTMGAIDSMPENFRRLVHEFDYIDIYRAWKRGWSEAKIRAHVANNTFTFPG